MNDINKNIIVLYYILECIKWNIIILTILTIVNAKINAKINVNLINVNIVIEINIVIKIHLE